MLIHEKKIKNLFILWLTSSLFLIFLMIIVGGLTRLTDSGLSITEWQLFSGILPPLNESSWEIYFNLYKDIPQYKLINPNMTLDEFKIIFYWEYIHRALGRLIGLFFLLPLLYFHFVKKINFEYLIPYYLILILIIFQGIVGWYMVTSGLSNNVTVSHYRLSIHLIIAILIISIIFWQLLNVKNNKTNNFFNFKSNKIPFIFLIFLLYLQIILGAFVSGLDAGKIYQTWPYMGNKLFPDDLIFSLNILIDFDNHSLVQFYHRNVAYFISFYILILCFYILKKKNKKFFKHALFLILILLIQVFLGIFTLISNLNILLASAHQISSVILVLGALNLYYSIIK